MRPHERSPCSLELRRVVGVHGLHSVVPGEVPQCDDRLGRALGLHGCDVSDSGAHVHHEESAFLSVDALVCLAVHDEVVSADDVAELGDGLSMSRSLTTRLAFERLRPETDFAHRVLGPVSHHVPDGDGFRDELVLRRGVQVGKSVNFDVALELDLRDGDVELLVVDRDLGGERGRLVRGCFPDVRVDEHRHATLDRASDLLPSADDQSGTVFPHPVEVVSTIDHEAAKAEDVDGVLQDDGVDDAVKDADVHHHPGVLVDHSVRRGQLHGAVHGDAVDLEVSGSVPAAVHEVILRAGVEAPLLDPMHVLLCGHAESGVHGREGHVDDLAVAVVLDVVVVLKVDATSSRGDRDCGSGV